jgi:hypothetical protein
LFVNLPDAWATVTPVQTESIPLTQTDWNSTTSQLIGSNPMVFNQFNSALGTLNSVNLTVSYTTVEAAGMMFTTPATITLSTAFPGTNTGTTLSLEGPGGTGNLLTATAPVFTYTRTYGGAPGQTLPQLFSTDTNRFAPGSPFLLTPNGQPGNTTNSFTGTQTITFTNPAQLALFTGSGTVDLPAAAKAWSSFTTTSGNGMGAIQTFAGMKVSLSYTYTVPEPSSVALLGLGGGGLLLLGRLRRKAAAV